jgi:hypothetical protein
MLEGPVSGAAPARYAIAAAGSCLLVKHSSGSAVEQGRRPTLSHRPSYGRGMAQFSEMNRDIHRFYMGIRLVGCGVHPQSGREARVVLFPGYSVRCVIAALQMAANRAWRLLPVSREPLITVR